MSPKFVAILLFFLPTTVNSKDYFTAAVFEHRPHCAQSLNPLFCRADISETPEETISKNLYLYEKATKIAASKGADIIVFNEYGIFPYVPNRESLQKFMEIIPDPRKLSYNPCVDEAIDVPILRSLSCIAKENKIYLVANLGDKQYCHGSCDSSIKNCSGKCPEDGILLYNTNVAFDPVGNLVARYHKFHPYLELVNVDEEPGFVTFKTNFGTFGLIVCFDAVFQESVLLAKDFGIDTLLFPTFWFDDILPLNAVEFQQSWALANKVNFVAANAQTPGLGSLGSGIYSKDVGALVYSYDPDGLSKLLIANVKVGNSSETPVNPSITVITEDDTYEKTDTGEHFPEYCSDKKLGPASDVYKDYRCFKNQVEKYTLEKIETDNGHVETCNNGFCCSVTYLTEGIQNNFYLAVFNGTNNVRNYFHWKEETCLLIRCDPLDGRPCVLQSSTSNTVFKFLEMKAWFTTKNVYSTVTKNKFRLAPKKEWKYDVDEYGVTLKFKAESNEPLLKVGLLGRCYQRDPPFTPWYIF